MSTILNYNIEKENDKLSPCFICKGRGYIIQLDSIFKKKECKFCEGTGIVNPESNYEYWKKLYQELISQLEDNNKSRDIILQKIEECFSNLNNLS